MGEYLLGVDLGSSSCKIVLIDINGNVCAKESCGYKTYYPKSGWTEQNPNDWYQAFVEALYRIDNKINLQNYDIKALCIDGVTHNAALLDSNGKVLRKCITFFDARSTEQVKQLKKDFGDRLFEIGFNGISEAWTFPQLLWIKENEPEIFNKIDKILFPKDYLRYKLTNEIVTDHIDAQGTLMYDIKKGEWDKDSLNYIGLHKENFPEITAPDDVGGIISQEAANKLPLREGIPIIVGASDTVMEVFGAGAIKNGQATIKLASVGRICVVSESPVLDKRILNYQHLIDDKWYPGTWTKAAATSLQWIKELICRQEDEAANNLNINPYQIMELCAKKSSPGANGLLFHPFLNGESCPYFNHSLRSNFLGLSFQHKKEDLLRAVYEGVAFSLRDSLKLIKNTELEIQELRLIGGGSKSDLWSQILTDIVGTKIYKVKEADAAFGAALLAGVGSGVYNSYEDAVDQSVKISEELTPNIDNKDTYNKLFGQYRKAVNILEDFYNEFTDITKNIYD